MSVGVAKDDLATRRMVAGTIAGIGAVGAWWLHGHPPSTTGWYPPCIFHELTGLHCPGCGATRAAYALLHGHVVEALHQNALLVIAAPFLAVIISRAVWRWIEGAPSMPVHEDPSRWIARLSLLVAPIVILFGILRNLPWQPFTCLAPF
jgi:hypothetical protein